MTAERLAELRRLAEAATPGPWGCWNAYDIPGTDRVGFSRIGPNDGGGVESPAHSSTDIQCRKADVAYIVAAANAIPELLDELEAAQMQLMGEGRTTQALRDRADSLAAQLQESEAENEGLRCDLGRVAPTEYRCRKAKGWLCGLGYGHTGGCMAVNHPHPLGGE